MPNYPYSFQLPPLNVQDIPNDGAVGEFLGINVGGALDWLPVASGGGDMLKSENLSGLANYTTARTNIGLGTASTPTFANLTLTSPSLSSSAPVTISQTWAGTGSTVFKALVVNATTPGTTSSSSSLLLDLQVGGVSQFSVNKIGQASALFSISSQYLSITQNASIASDAGALVFGATSSVWLRRDGADNTLALRNGAAAQTFNIYASYSDAGASYSRLSLGPLTGGDDYYILTGNAGTGIARGLNLRVGTGRSVYMGVGSVDIFRFSTAGLTFQADNTYDIGANGANRPRNVYVVNAYPSNIELQNVAANYGWVGSSKIYSQSNGVIRLSDSSSSDFNRLQFGGTTNLFPAIKRNAAGLQIRLADDSANATLEAGNLYASGNVGIGTTAPSTKLDVAGTFASQGFTSVQRLGGSGQSISMYARGAGDISNIGNPLGNGVAELSTNAPGLVIGVTGASPMVLGTNNLERVRILSTGEVGIGTTSPTSKLHVVGDAVLTGDLLGTNYTIGVPTILTQSNISITNNHSGVADSAIVITPKGTGGVIFGPKPDGTTVGGAVRGLYAIDLQLIKTATTHVASGNYSVICGGGLNIGSGVYSAIGGGSENRATQNYSTVAGGNNCQATGVNSTIGGGLAITASGSYSFVGGGQSNTCSASYSFIAAGSAALANRYGLSAHAAGQFAAQGDAQSSRAVFRNKTTTNSAVELFLDGASARYTVTSGKIISMLINITGTKSDGSAVAHYVRQYSIKNIGGTTSQVYAAVTVGTDNAAGTSIAISADDTNDSLKIEVTGVAAETWRWVASVDAVEVGHGV